MFAGNADLVNESTKTIPVTNVIFREDLYPRIKSDPATVQKYADNLEVLPPIEVNQHYELIDGWHRWTAHKKNGVEQIAVTITETNSDAQLLEFAIERNATFGLQLSQEDKKKMAVKIYLSSIYKTEEERRDKKAHLAKILSVTGRSIRDWLSRSDKERKDDLRQLAFDLWMSCHTQEKIAQAVGYSEPVIRRFIDASFRLNGNFAATTETDEIAKEAESDDDEEDVRGFGRIKLTPAQLALSRHEDENFDRPIYNVWKQQTKSNGVKHPGNSEVRWVDNLLYLYTQPFDIVVDPFAGGGSTIDICRKRLRRYWVSDRKPTVEREKEIRKHDVTNGLPGSGPAPGSPPDSPSNSPPRWQDVKLVYLDPPYWKQAEGKYSDDPTDLANMPLEQFNSTLAGLINSFSKKLPAGAVIALLIQPTQWNAPEKAFTDHVADMLRAVKLPIVQRFSCPYESQQGNAQMVEWAKANKQCLVLTRELVVWEVR